MGAPKVAACGGLSVLLTDVEVVVVAVVVESMSSSSLTDDRKRENVGGDWSTENIFLVGKQHRDDSFFVVHADDNKTDGEKPLDTGTVVADKTTNASSITYGYDDDVFGVILF